MSAASRGIRGGQPSTTQPRAGPWLSPKVVTRNRWPKLLWDMALHGCSARLRAKASRCHASPKRQVEARAAPSELAVRRGRRRSVRQVGAAGHGFRDREQRGKGADPMMKRFSCRAVQVLLHELRGTLEGDLTHIPHEGKLPGRSQRINPHGYIFILFGGPMPLPLFGLPEEFVSLQPAFDSPAER